MRTDILGARGCSRRQFLSAAGLTLAGAGLHARAVPALETDKVTSPMLDPSYASLLSRLRTPRKQAALVVPASYQQGTFDALAVDAPFVFSHDGRYYMTYIGFDGVGYRTGLASSEDLVAWKKEGMLLDRGGAGSFTEFNVALTWIVRENELFGPGTLKKIGGRFLGTYHAYPKPGYETGPAVIGLCWSDDLKQWTLDAPCLHASDPGAGDWERGGLYKSCLVEQDGTYYLFYNAKTADSPWIEQTGVAISADLKTWKRFEGNPVLHVGPKGSFDDIFCSDPGVVRCGDIWAMFFYTLSSDGRARDSVAFSRDLLHWEKSNEILIDTGPPGSIDSRYAHKPAVFAKNGRLYHFYCAVSPATEKKRGNVEVDEIRGIGLATS